MATTMSTYDAILKEDYGEAIREQLVNSNFLLQRLQRRGSETTQGREFAVPVHVSRNVGVAARSEYDDLPAAGQQGYVLTTFKPVMITGRIELTEWLINATRNDRGAFIRALDAEMKGLITDFKRNVQRQLHGDGTGLLASVTAAGTGVTTISVDNVKYLQVNMIVDILTRANGAAVATSRTITAIDTANKTITISGAAINVTTAEGVYIYGSYNKELTGLKKIVSNTGVLQGIDPAQYPVWKANVLDNGGTTRPVNELLMQQAWDATEENGDTQPDVVITTFGVRRAYQNLLTSLKRFTSPMELEGGWTALEYNGKPLLVDHDCPANTIYFLPLEHLALYQYAEPGWMDRDGAILNRVSNKAAYEATYLWFVQLATDRRNALTVLKDVSES